MSKELELYKSKSHLNKVARTVGPNDSASQMSSNVRYEEGEEAGGDAAKRIARTRARQIAGKIAMVSHISKVLKASDYASPAVGSSVSRHAAMPKLTSALEIGDTNSRVSSAKDYRSILSADSKTSDSTVKPLSHAPRSSVSTTSSRVSSRSPSSALSSSKLSVHEPSIQLEKGILPSDISTASSGRSSTMLKIDTSQISRASSREPSESGRLSFSSRNSRALVPARHSFSKASPLRNEITADDVEDDMYSISIHERGLVQNMPTRDEIIAAILRKNPTLEVDEATVIADKQIASTSKVGRSFVDKSIAPASTAEKASTTKKSIAAPFNLSSASKPESIASKALSNRSGSVSRSLRLPSVVSVTPRMHSIVSKASTIKDREVLCANPQSSVASASPLDVLVSSSAIVSFPAGIALPVTHQGSVGELGNSDLLALAEIRAVRELQRQQTIASFEAQRGNFNSDLAVRRITELELAKQALEDSRAATFLQELAINDAKLKDLSRHAHEDRLSALERAESAEADRRSSLASNALHDKFQQERARNRELRGDIEKAERRREDERNMQIQRDYERLDQDNTIDVIDSFSRISDARRPRELPRPQRTNVDFTDRENYRNPNTGGQGTVAIRTGSECSGSRARRGKKHITYGDDTLSRSGSRR